MSLHLGRIFLSFFSAGHFTPNSLIKIQKSWHIYAAWYLKPDDMDLFCVGSCDLLCVQCQTAVIELILVLIRKNNTMFLSPVHGEGCHLGHARVHATGVPCSQQNSQSHV